MRHFDFRTAYLVVSLLWVLLPLGSAIILAGRRQPAVTSWSYGGISTGLGIGLVSMRGMIPDIVSVTLANLLLLGGFLLVLRALRQELGHNLPWRRLLLWLVTFIAVLEAIRIGSGDDRLRFAYVTLVYGVLIAVLVWHAAWLARQQRVVSPYWISAGLLLLLVAFTIRFFDLLAAPQPLMAFESAATPSPYAVGVALAAILMAIMAQIGFLGLYLERSGRERERAITQRAHLEADRLARERIADLDRQRSLGELSGSLAVSLHQPLQAIRSAVAGLQPTCRHAERSRLLAVLDEVIGQVKRASALIEAVRGYLRPARFTPVPVDLARVLRELVGLIGAEARQHHVAIRFQLPESSLRIKGDAVLLAQALFHACRNAIQAMQEVAHRELCVHANPAGDKILVSVCDSGPGMSEALLAQVGRPFLSGHRFGLGLGLAIAASIIQLHGGRLTASRALGGGICIDIELPAEAAMADGQGSLPGAPACP